MPQFLHTLITWTLYPRILMIHSEVESALTLNIKHSFKLLKAHSDEMHYGSVIEPFSYVFLSLRVAPAVFFSMGSYFHCQTIHYHVLQTREVKIYFLNVIYACHGVFHRPLYMSHTHPS